MGRGKHSKDRPRMSLRTRLFDKRHRLEIEAEQRQEAARVANPQAADKATQVFQTVLGELTKQQKDAAGDFIWRQGSVPKSLSTKQLAILIAAEERIQNALVVHKLKDIRAARQERLQRLHSARGIQLMPLFLEQEYQKALNTLSWNHAPVAQGTERRPPKPKDSGSNPLRRIRQTVLSLAEL